MASLIPRASLQQAAHAARSVVSAASRCAAAAEAVRSGFGGGGVHAAAASYVAAPAAAVHGGSGSTSTIATQGPPRFVKQDGMKFEADEKDLESDEALWALYEGWCKHFNQKRDRDEMVRWFSSFKETVLCVEENKKSDLPYKLGINQFADGKLAELHSNDCHIDDIKRIPYSTSPIYGTDFVRRGRARRRQAQLKSRINLHESPSSQDPQNP